jgi:DNA-binding CsgD family transcriptional regulator
VDAAPLSDLGELGNGLAQPLVERESALELAAQALEGARAGRGSVLVLEGPSGTGKSSVLATVRASAFDALDVFPSAGHELERDFSFGVVVQLFESRLARASKAERDRLFSGAAHEAVTLFESGPRHSPPDPSFSVLHGLYRLCANLAEGGGIAILIDDVDLADPASIRFLLYLSERIEQLPVAMLVTNGSAVRPSHRQLLEQLLRHRAATRHRLEPLSVGGTKRQLRDGWFAEASEDFCVAVHGTTGGNPYLVRQVAATVSATGLDPDGGATGVRDVAPPAIAATAIRRAATVGDDAPALLRAVALLGNGAALRHAAALAGLETEHALWLVDGLIEAGLLEDDEQHLAFVHPVVRKAVAASQRPAERAGANLRAARLLLDEEAPAERVAGHLMEATRTGSGWAVGTLCDAAAAALGRGAPDTAVRYLRRALEEPPPRELRAHVVLELGRAEATAGEPEAVQRLHEAIERMQDGRDRARASLDTGRTLFALGRHADAAAALRRGIDELGDGDTELGARLQAAYATVSRLQPRAAHVAAEPVAPPERDESPADRANLALLAMEAAVRGDPRDQVHELAARALARGALLDDETADGIAYYLASGALVLAEDLQTAEAALTAAVQEAQSRGSVLGFATASYFRSVAIMRRGRVGDAAADARQAIAAQRYGWRLAMPAARAVLAETFIEKGDIEAARKQLGAAELEAADQHPARLGLLSTRGGMRLLGGDAEGALADFLECRDYVEGIGAWNPALVAWRSGAARACGLLGDWGEAVVLVEAELALAEAFGAPGPIGRALRVLGAVREGPSALEALEAAVGRLDRSQAALERARALVDFGAALRRNGHRRASREPLRLGLDLAERCGAESLAARALREAHAAGARPRRTALSGLGALTPRERQVASLAARGLSNREIAETLVVTVKTVEWHLRHTFEKLEVGSRGQLRELFAGAED